MFSGRSVVGSSSIRDLFKISEVQRLAVDLDLRLPFPTVLDPRNTFAAAGVVLVFPAIPAVFSRGCQPEIFRVVVQTVPIPMIYLLISWISPSCHRKDNSVTCAFMRTYAHPVVCFFVFGTHGRSSFFSSVHRIEDVPPSLISEVVPRSFLPAEPCLAGRVQFQCFADDIHWEWARLPS